MSITRYLFTAFLALSLSGCLKVTGEAKDQFDLEDEENPPLFGPFTVGGSSSQEPVPAQTAQEPATSGALPDEPVVNKTLDVPDVGTFDTYRSSVQTPSNESPTIAPDTLSEQEFADFQKWRSERESGSEEYQEFLEYQEYKKWLEFQKEKTQ